MSFHIGNLKIGDWLKGMHIERLFENNNADEIGKNADLLIQNLKSYVHDPKVDFYTAVIPGEWDDKAVALARKALDHIANTITDFEHAPGNSIGEKFAAVLDKVKTNDDKLSLFLHNSSSLAVKVFGDGKFDLSDGFLIAETIFRAVFKKKAATT